MRYNDLMDAPYLTAILADDEPAITEGLSSLPVWEELGISVIGTADSGKAALEKITSLRPDFAIMDIMMPGMTGLDVLERLEEAASDTDIIILSGYGNFEYARKALKFQAKAYLLKPVDAAELRETLLSLMKRRIQEDAGEALRVSRTTLNDLADGKLIDTATVTRMLTSGAKGLSDGNCFAMIFSFPSNMKEGTLTSLETATEGIKRILWNKDQKTIRAIFSISERTPFEIAEACLKALSDKDQTLPRIAIGNTVNSLGAIATSFSRASMALSYQLYDENGRIFTSDIIASTPPAYKPADRDIEPLKEYILANDREGIREYCENFIKTLLGNTLPPPNYVYSITNWLIREAGNRLSPLIDTALLIPEAPDITKYRTIPALEDGLVSLFERLASYIAAVYGKDAESRLTRKEEDDDEIIQKMIRYIDEHTEEQVRLEDIASLVNLSPSYAAIYFRKKTGTTLREFMLQRKMEDARKKLLERDASVTDIAYNLGYHDYRSFSRAFKNITGITPSEFQELHAK